MDGVTTGFGTTSNLGIEITLPGYRLRRQVGSDSIGLWFDVEQESLDRKLTVKILKPEYSRHPKAREEFLAEMDRLAGLEHPNLLRILDTQRDEGAMALITERIGADTLLNRLKPGTPLGEATSFRVALGVARALRYLQARGFAHKSISPCHISLREDDRCRLVTFRNVIPFEDQVALKGKLAQDAHYVAPEQLAGNYPVGPNTACYQVGALLFHMLAGRPAHPTGTPAEVAKAHFQQPFPSLKSAQPFLTNGIYGLVAACTVRRPTLRPDLDELVRALETLIEGGDPAIEPQPDPDEAPAKKAISAPTPRRRRRRR